MSDTKHQKMLERVRALIAKADSTNFPEEADAFRAKADELMEQYTIEMWMVKAAQDGVGKRPEPEMRDIDFSWYWGHPRKSELWSLMSSTSYHCRVVVVTRGIHGDKIKVAGLPADLDYFDMLFTHLLLEFGRRLLPHVEPGLSPQENAYNLRTASLGWPEIAFMLSRAGMLPWATVPNVDTEGMKYDSVASWDLNAAQQWRRKARKLYRDYIRINGLEAESSKKPEVAHRSYAQGFVQELSTKMRNQERLSAEKHSTDNERAVALRDIRMVVRDFVDSLFPPPEVTATATKQRRSRAVTYREEPFDPNAYNRGKMDARDVDVVQSAQNRLKNRKELSS